MTDLYLEASAGWTAPSEIDYDPYDPGRHETFCLDPVHKGPCAKPQTQQSPTANADAVRANAPQAKPVPNAPDEQQVQMHKSAAMAQAHANQQAALKAQQLAEQLGAKGHPAQAHYEGALKKLYGAEVKYAQAVKAAQDAHANGLDANAATQAAETAKLAAAQARDAVNQAQQLLQHAGKKGPSATAANAATQKIHQTKAAASAAKAQATAARNTATANRATRAATPAARPGFSTSFELYAAPVTAEEWLYGHADQDHYWCNVGAFCRNPLHPGPCKGWKHTLHSVAPGAYHAMEQRRVQILNERRVARIKQIEAAGGKVPSWMRKPITYDPTKLTPQPNYTPPTPKEAEAAIPATSKEIGAKIAQKHADIAEAKKAQVQAHAAATADTLAESSKALGHPVPDEVKGNMAQALAKQHAELKPGETLADHPAVQETIKKLAQTAGEKAGVGDQGKATIEQDIKDHIAKGEGGVPLGVQAAVNVAKKHAEKKAAEAAKAKPAEPEVQKIGGGKRLEDMPVVGKPAAGPVLPTGWHDKPANGAVTDQLLHDKIAGSSISISKNLAGLKLTPEQKATAPHNAISIFAGEVKPDGTVLSQAGQVIGQKIEWHGTNGTEDQGWIHVQTTVPGASGGYRSVAVWKGTGKPTEKSPSGGAEVPGKKAAPQRGTWKTHANLNEGVYYGRGVKSNGKGIHVKISSEHGLLTFRDAETGKKVEQIGHATKFWLAPLPTPEGWQPAKTAADVDHLELPNTKKVSISGPLSMGVTPGSGAAKAAQAKTDKVKAYNAGIAKKWFAFYHEAMDKGKQWDDLTPKQQDNVLNNLALIRKEHPELTAEANLIEQKWKDGLHGGVPGSKPAAPIQEKSLGTELHSPDHTAKQAVALDKLGKTLGGKTPSDQVIHTAVDIAKEAQANGQKFTEHPLAQKTIDILAEKAEKKILQAYDGTSMSDSMKTKLKAEITDHLEHGKTGLPPMLESALKYEADQKANTPSKPAHISTYIPEHAHTTLAAKKATYYPNEKVATLDQLETGGPTLVGKVVPLPDGGTSGHGWGLIVGQPTFKFGQSVVAVAEPGKGSHDVPVSTLKHHVAGWQEAEQAAAKAAAPVTEGKPAGLHPDMLALLHAAVGTDGEPEPSPLSLSLKVSRSGVTKAEFDKLEPTEKLAIRKALMKAHAESQTQFIKDKLAQRYQELTGAPIEGGAAAYLAAKTEAAKSTGELAHPDMMALAGEAKLAKQGHHVFAGAVLAAIKKPGVTKEEIDKLPDSTKKDIAHLLSEAVKNAPDNWAAQDLMTKYHQLNLGEYGTEHFNDNGQSQIDALIEHGAKADVLGESAAALRSEWHAALKQGTMLSDVPSAKNLVDSIASEVMLHNPGLLPQDKATVKEAIWNHVMLGKPGVHNFVNNLPAVKSNKVTALGETPKGGAVETALEHAKSPHSDAGMKLAAIANLTPEQFQSLSSGEKGQIIGGLIKAASDSPVHTEAAKNVAHAIGGGELWDKAAPILLTPEGPTPTAPLGPEVAAHVKTAQSLASKATYATDTQKLLAYQTLTHDEFHSLPEHIQVAIHDDLAKMQDKFLDPKKIKGANDLAKTFGLPKAPAAGAGTGGGMSPTEQQLHESAAKYAKTHLAIWRLVHQTEPSQPVKDAVAQNYVNMTHSPSFHNQAKTTIWGLAQTWSEKNLVGHGLTKEQQHAIKEMVDNEMEHMMEMSKTSPDPHGVLAMVEDAKTHDPESLSGKLHALAITIGVPDEQVAQKATTPGGIEHIPEETQKNILAAFKLNTYGAQLKDPADVQYDLLLAVAKAFSKDKTFQGGLTLRQVAKVVDKQHAHNLGVSNSGLLEQKITDWLKTPAGAEYAKSHATPNPEMVKKMTPGKLSKGVKLKPGQKIQQVGGPGSWAKVSAIPDSHFVGHSHSQAMKERNDYFAQHGAWTQDQRDAAEAYTTSSGTINNYLRGYDTGSMTTQKAVTDIQAAMIPIKTQKLVRGMDWDGDFAQFKYNPEAAVGKVVSDPAFLSTTVAGEGTGFSGSVRLEIQAPEGTMGLYLEDVSHFQGHGENEMLLAAGTQMKVLSTRQEGMQQVFVVRVVGAKTVDSAKAKQGHGGWD